MAELEYKKALMDTRDLLYETAKDQFEEEFNVLPQKNDVLSPLEVRTSTPSKEENYRLILNLLKERLPEDLSENLERALLDHTFLTRLKASHLMKTTNPVVLDAYLIDIKNILQEHYQDSDIQEPPARDIHKSFQQLDVMGVSAEQLLNSNEPTDAGSESQGQQSTSSTRSTIPLATSEGQIYPIGLSSLLQELQTSELFKQQKEKLSESLPVKGSESILNSLPSESSRLPQPLSEGSAEVSAEQIGNIMKSPFTTNMAISEVENGNQINIKAEVNDGVPVASTDTLHIINDGVYLGSNVRVHFLEPSRFILIDGSSSRAFKVDNLSSEAIQWLLTKDVKHASSLELSQNDRIDLKDIVNFVRNGKGGTPSRKFKSLTQYAKREAGSSSIESSSVSGEGMYTPLSDAITKLNIALGSIEAGNTSNQNKDIAMNCLDILLKRKKITKTVYDEIATNILNV